MSEGPGRFLIGPAELAKMLNVSRSQIYNMNRDGKLPRSVSVAGPKWGIDEIRAWIAAKCPEHEAWEVLKALAHQPAED